MATRMTAQQRAEFRGFCRQATDNQIRNIVADERGRAKREAALGDESDYYQTCAELAEAEAERRGIEITDT